MQGRVLGHGILHGKDASRSTVHRKCIFLAQSPPRVPPPQILPCALLENLAPYKQAIGHDVLALLPGLHIDDLAAVNGDEDHPEAVCVCEERVLALFSQDLGRRKWPCARMYLLHSLSRRLVSRAARLAREMLPRVGGLVRRGYYYRVDRDRAPEVEKLDGIRGPGDLDIQQRQVAMAQAIRVQMRQPGEQLVVEIDLLFPREGRPLADDLVQRPSVHVLEHHPHVLQTS